MKKWKTVAIAMAVTLALGGVLAGGFFAGKKYSDNQYSIAQAGQADELDRLKSELESTRNELLSLSSSLTSLEKELSEKEEKIKSLEADKEKLQRQYDELLSASDLDKQELKRLTAEIKNLQQQLETSDNNKQELQDQLNEKTQMLKDFQQRLQEKESKITELNQNISKLTEQIEDYSSQLKKAQSDFADLQKTYNELYKKNSDLLSQSTLDQKQIDDLSLQVSMLTNNVSSLEDEIKRLETLQQLYFDLSYMFSVSVSEWDNSKGKFTLDDYGYSSYDFMTEFLHSTYYKSLGYDPFYTLYIYFYDSDGNMVDQAHAWHYGSIPDYHVFFPTTEFSTENLIPNNEYMVQLRFVLKNTSEYLPIAYLSDVAKFTYKGNSVGYHIVFKSQNPIRYGKES